MATVQIEMDVRPQRPGRGRRLPTRRRLLRDPGVRCLGTRRRSTRRFWTFDLIAYRPPGERRLTYLTTTAGPDGAIFEMIEFETRQEAEAYWKADGLPPARPLPPSLRERFGGG